MQLGFDSISNTPINKIEVTNPLYVHKVKRFAKMHPLKLESNLQSIPISCCFESPFEFDLNTRRYRVVCE